MPRRVITRPVYDLMLTAFHTKPGNFTYAAEISGVGWRMCKTAWEKGWEHREPWAISIKQVLENEKLEAQASVREAEAKRMAEAEAAKARAQAGAIEAFEQEAQMVRSVRGGTIGTLNVVLRTLKGLTQACEHIDEEIKSASLTIDQRVDLLRSSSLAMKRVAESAYIALEAQRKHIGAPDHVLKVEGLDGNASDESIQEELRALISAARRAGMATVDVTPEVTNGSNGANGAATPPALPERT